jgi:thioredoxin-related protein
MKVPSLKAIAVSLVFAAATVLCSPSGQATEQPVLGDDGLYHHAWFFNSFLDLADDLDVSAEGGKRLVLMVEQKGCGYCKKVQTELLTDPKINAYVREHYNVVQLNMWGDREVTDFDGEVLPEKQLARKWRVLFTPTIVFFPPTRAETEGKSGIDAAVAVMPGAFGKGTFLALFEWVKEERYKSGEPFQKYVIDKMEQMGTGQPTN